SFFLRLPLGVVAEGVAQLRGHLAQAGLITAGARLRRLDRPGSLAGELVPPAGRQLFGLLALHLLGVRLLERLPLLRRHLQVLEDVLVDLGEVVQLEHAGAAAVRGVARRRLRLVGALALQQPLLAVGDVGRVAVAPLAAGLARALRRVHLAILLALAAFLAAALARAGAVAVAALALARRAVPRPGPPPRPA